MVSKPEITEETSVPMKAVIALLTGCAIFTGSAFTAGSYFGSRDANATSVTARVEKLEIQVDAMSLVDRRLARIEGALGVKVPEEDRLPVSRHAP